MIKMAVFDIDDTLAFVGQPILDENVKLLKEIEEAGIKIAISSGKSIYYQIGMFRQAGLKNPVFIGENGCSIAFGIKLPPKVLNTVEPDGAFFKSRKRIYEELCALCPEGFWLQPNEVMLTFFFKDAKIRDKMREYFKQCTYEGITVYEHVDSFDVVPKNVDKYTSLERLCDHLNIGRDEVIAVGDGANDVPMLQFCKYSIGVYGLDKALTTYHFDDIKDALEFIIKSRSEL